MQRHKTSRAHTHTPTPIHPTPHTHTLPYDTTKQCMSRKQQKKVTKKKLRQCCTEMVMLIGTNVRLRYVNIDDFCIKVNNNVLEIVDHFKCLSVIFDNELKWHNQVNNVARKLEKYLANLHF